MPELCPTAEALVKTARILSERADDMRREAGLIQARYLVDIGQGVSRP